MEASNNNNFNVTINISPFFDKWDWFDRAVRDALAMVTLDLNDIPITASKSFVANLVKVYYELNSLRYEYQFSGKIQFITHIFEVTHSLLSLLSAIDVHRNNIGSDLTNQLIGWVNGFAAILHDVVKECLSSNC